MRKQAQRSNSINTESNVIIKSNNFDFTDSKTEKQFNYEYHHWGANKKVMDIINKRGESPETLPVIEKRQEITKPGNIRFKFDGNLNRKVWVPRRPDKRGRDEVAAIDLELLFRINEKKRWGGGYFEFKESKPSSSKEPKKTPEQSMNEPEPPSSTEESEVANLRRILQSLTARVMISPKRRYTISKLFA